MEIVLFSVLVMLCTVVLVIAAMSKFLAYVTESSLKERGDASSKREEEVLDKSAATIASLKAEYDELVESKDKEIAALKAENAKLKKENSKLEQEIQEKLQDSLDEAVRVRTQARGTINLVIQQAMAFVEASNEEFIQIMDFHWNALRFAISWVFETMPVMIQLLDETVKICTEVYKHVEIDMARFLLEVKASNVNTQSLRLATVVERVESHLSAFTKTRDHKAPPSVSSRRSMRSGTSYDPDDHLSLLSDDQLSQMSYDAEKFPYFGGGDNSSESEDYDDVSTLSAETTQSVTPATENVSTPSAETIQPVTPAPENRVVMYRVDGRRVDISGFFGGAATKVKAD